MIMVIIRIIVFYVEALLINPFERFAEFPDKASIGDLDKHDTIKSLANTCISYSACSSFAALSGNTDLQLHSSSQTPAEAQKSEERIVIDGEMNSTEDGQNVKKREEGKTLHEESEDALQCNEEDDKEEPIDHLLKVKKTTCISVRYNLKRKPFGRQFSSLIWLYNHFPSPRMLLSFATCTCTKKSRLLKYF